MNEPAIRVHGWQATPATFAEEVLQGLAARPKRIAPKYFYDERGSRLFDAICTLPEYYLTRTEMGILESCADDVARLAGPDCTLIELGSGASRKIRLLLETLRPRHYRGGQRAPARVLSGVDDWQFRAARGAGLPAARAATGAAGRRTADRR
jgi:uncharacterized SAM-dependent methyltransferase